MISGPLVICLLNVCRKWTWKYSQSLDCVVHSTSLHVTFVRTLDPARLHLVLEPFAIHTVLRPWSVITRYQWLPPPLLVYTNLEGKRTSFFEMCLNQEWPYSGMVVNVFLYFKSETPPESSRLQISDIRGFNAKPGGKETRGLQICPHRQPQDAFTNMVSVPYHAASQWGEWDPNNPPMITGMGSVSLTNE